LAERVQISVRRDLYEKAERFIREQGGFQSVEELVEFLLEEALAAGGAGGGETGGGEDEERVKERLRALGYI